MLLIVVESIMLLDNTGGDYNATDTGGDYNATDTGGVYNATDNNHS